MNLPNKLALGFVGTIALTITAAVIVTINEQQETINRLKKNNAKLREGINLLYRIELRDETVIEDVHNFVIKHTEIPDDISKLQS